MRRGPGPLGIPSFQGIPEASRQAWWADLTRWVERIRAEYAHLWPERPPGIDVTARGRPRPFPACWAEHRAVVADLAVLKTWHEGLEQGKDWAGGVQGWHEWRVFLDRFASYLQLIARLCTPLHQDGVCVPQTAARQRSAVSW